MSIASPALIAVICIFTGVFVFAIIYFIRRWLKNRRKNKKLQEIREITTLLEEKEKVTNDFKIKGDASV